MEGARVVAERHEAEVKAEGCGVAVTEKGATVAAAYLNPFNKKAVQARGCIALERLSN
jgi:hypothetical protein